MNENVTGSGQASEPGSDLSQADGHQPRVESRWERPLISTAGGEATLLVRVTAPADSAAIARRAPLDVAFVLDRSGSMGGAKLPLAKEGVDLAVARLRDADRAALVVYDDQVDTVQPLAAATPRLKASLRLALHGIDPGGSTYLSGGWVAGCQELAEAPPMSDGSSDATRIRRVILLTDGLANVGILDPGELARHAGELRRRGIATTTVGVGRDFDEGLLSAMAEAGGGNFQYVADPEELRAFFAQELQELFTVAVTGLTVALSLPEGVSAELIAAFPVETCSGSLQVAIGDLPAGDVIDLVFTLRAAPGAAGDQLPVGVSASWTDARADARHQRDVSPSPLRRADSETIAASEADLLVVERAALQRAAAERRAGLDLDRAGRYVESRQRMARSQAMLQAAPMTLEVQASLHDGEAFLAAPPTAAYDSHQRKLAQHREELRRRGRRGTPPTRA